MTEVFIAGIVCTGTVTELHSFTHDSNSSAESCGLDSSFVEKKSCDLHLGWLFLRTNTLCGRVCVCVCVCVCVWAKADGPPTV